MPIYELLRKARCFTPEEVTVLGNAFEDLLKALGLIDRKDPMTETGSKEGRQGPDARTERGNAALGHQKGPPPLLRAALSAPDEVNSPQF